jgi:hypothetical protein
VQTLQYLKKKKKKKMAMKTLKKLPQKWHTHGSLDFFLSAASTVQNSPELYIHFTDFCIQ